MVKKRFVARLAGEGTQQAAVLTPKQFKRLMLMTAAGQNAKRNVAILWHSYGSGLRVSEIAALRVKDAIERNGAIKRVAKLPGASAKGDKPRDFFQVEREHHTALSDYLAERLEKRRRLGDNAKQWRGLDPDSPLYLARGASGFVTARKTYAKKGDDVGEAVVCVTLQQLLTKLHHRAGIMRGSSHSGRRTLASRLNARGVDIELIQRILGHSSSDMTAVYIEPSEEAIAKAMARVYPDL